MFTQGRHRAALKVHISDCKWACLQPCGELALIYEDRNHDMGSVKDCHKKNQVTRDAKPQGSTDDGGQRPSGGERAGQGSKKFPA